MSSLNFTHIMTKTVDELSESESLKGLFHQHRDGNPLPSGKALQEIIELSRSIIFPGYYGKSTVNIRTIRYHIGVNIERMYKLLADQVLAGLCFSHEDDEDGSELNACNERAGNIAAQLISKLPKIRSILATDVEAAYNGDPAADSISEIISCYPVIKTLTN